VVVKRGGRQVKLIDTRTSREITLHAGTYQIELTAGKEGLKLSTNQFDLERNGRVIVKVHLEAPAAKPPPPSAEETAAEAALRVLLAREREPGRDVPRLRTDVLAFLRKHRGTEAAVRGAGLLGRLPSPLDQFKREQIPAYELAAAGNGHTGNAPAELVAVLGDSRLRHWGRGARAAFSPDGKTLASLGYDRVIRLWNPDTGKELGILPAAFTHPHVPVFSQDGKMLAATTSGGWVAVWNIDSKKIVRLFPVRSEPEAISFAFHPKKRILAIAAADGLVKLFSTETTDELRSLGFKGAAVNVMAFSPDGGLLAATDNWGGRVRIWDTETGKVHHTLEGKHGAIPYLSFSPDGKTLATAGDHLIKWWDLQTGKEKKQIVAHANRIWGLAYSSDGKKLGSASWDGAIKIWNASTGELQQSMTAGYPIVSLAFRRDSTTLATGHHDGTIRLWDSSTGKELQARSVTYLYSLAFTGDSKTLVVGGRSTGKTGALQRWPIIPGKAARSLPVSTAGCTMSVALSPDGRTLAAGSEDETVQLWDLSKERTFATIKGFRGRVLSVAFSPDGRLLAAGGDDHNVRICDVIKGDVRLRLVGHQGIVNSVAFSPDGKTLASGGHDKVIVLWNVANGNKKLILRHDAEVHSVAFSPDGKELAHGGSDDSVTIWNLTTGKSNRTLEGLGGAVTWGPDGRFLASVNYSKVSLRDARTGKTLRTFQLGPSYGIINQIRFSPDSRYLATANWNSTVYILRLAGPAPAPE
jgi:WD40 repeat protein